MKVYLHTLELQEAIKKAQKNMMNSKQTPLQALLSVKLSALNNSITLTANNLETVTIFKLSGNIQEQGEILLSAETLKLITKIKNTYQIEISDNLIEAGNKKLKFISAEVEQFPITLDECTVVAFTIGQPELIKALSVNYASGFEENRPVFKSVCLDQNTFVATDTHRMAWYKAYSITNNLDKPVIVPYKVTKLLHDTLLNKKSIQPVNVSVDEKYRFLKVEFEDTTVITRLLEGTFPNYKSIMPKDHKTSVKLNVKKLLEELSFVEDLAKKSDNNSITIAIDENNIYFDAMSEGNAVTLEIESVITGDQIECLGIDYKLLIDALKNVEGEEIEIQFNGSYAPVCFNNSIVLPLRLPEMKRYNNVA